MSEFNLKDLVGKTITDAKKRKHSKCDDEGFLDLTFSDGTKCTIVANYSSYTGDSVYEYPTTIYVKSYGYETLR